MRHYLTLLSAHLICLFAALPAWAQEAEEEPEKGYVMSYFIVGLGIALGLVAVCRPAKRAKRVRKPE